jgi:hypothetical protein
MPKHRSQRDEFAELYVAAVLADAGWSVYFPRRDKGFDFIIAKQLKKHIVVRPVQVKGRFPRSSNSKAKNCGYTGTLTAFHREMVLAIPFFNVSEDLPQGHPDCIAYMPVINGNRGKALREPAMREKGKFSPRKTYEQFFDKKGLVDLERSRWRKGKKPAR